MKTSCRLCLVGAEPARAAGKVTQEDADVQGGRSPSRNPFGAAALQSRWSHVTVGHGPVCAVPEHGPGGTGHTRAGAWRRQRCRPYRSSPALEAAAPSLRGDGGHAVSVGLAWGRGHSGAIRSETEADTCFELFSSLLVPADEMFKYLSSLRLGLKARLASCWQPLEADQSPPHTATTVLGRALWLTALQEPASRNSWQETFLTVLLFICWFSDLTCLPLER